MILYINSATFLCVLICFLWHRTVLATFKFIQICAIKTPLQPNKSVAAIKVSRK